MNIITRFTTVGRLGGGLTKRPHNTQSLKKVLSFLKNRDTGKGQGERRDLGLIRHFK